MIMTYSTARDAMYGIVKSTWDANAVSVFGVAGEVRYAGVELLTTPDTTKPWAYVERLITTTRQSGLRRDIARRYTTVGVLSVDIYAPIAISAAMTKAEAMGDGIRRALENDRASGVWFRNVTAAPTGRMDGYVGVRVIADFEYTEEGESHES